MVTEAVAVMAAVGMAETVAETEAAATENFQIPSDIVS
jgi:hypothetical protein